jgi:hypothetical protein
MEYDEKNAGTLLLAKKQGTNRRLNFTWSTYGETEGGAREAGKVRVSMA